MSHARLASTLVLAEHSGGKLTPITLNAISAAQAVGGEVTALVAGGQVAEVAQQMASVRGVGKVLVAQDPAYDGFLPGVCVCVCVWCVCAGTCVSVYINGNDIGMSLHPAFFHPLYVASVCVCVCRVHSPTAPGSAEQAHFHAHLGWSLCHREGNHYTLTTPLTSKPQHTYTHSRPDDSPYLRFANVVHPSRLCNNSNTEVGAGVRETTR